ncbi:MAG: hypothetical protein QM820_22405 [Minicystis sp.]
MQLPPFVSRLIARLAFLASLLFALGNSPAGALVTLLASAGGADSSAIDRDDNELADDDVTLHKDPSYEGRLDIEADRRRGLDGRGFRAARAVPFVAPHRVTEAHPRPPYSPLVRMLC